MKIQNNIQSSYSTHKSPSFQSYYQRVMQSPSGRLLSTNNTGFFREDLTWERFVEDLANKYKDFKKVNIHCLACSDGAEPFSLAALLIKKLGKEGAKKFLPILASDVDPKILENPQKGKVLLSSYEIDLIESLLGKDYKKYIDHNNKFSSYPSYNIDDNLCKGKVSSLLRDAVQFEQKDVLKGAKDIKGASNEPSVVMIRNVWPYIQPKDRTTLSKTLRSVLNKDSAIVVGEFDGEFGVEQILKGAGFSQMYEFTVNRLRVFKKECNNLRNPEFMRAQLLDKLKLKLKLKL